MKLEQRVYATIANVMKVPIGTISKESSPETIAGWDSIQQMNLILALQQDFDVEIPLEEMVDLLSAEAIVRTMKNALRPAEGSE